MTSTAESVSSLGAVISVPAPSPDKAARLAGFPSGGSLWLTARDPFCVCLNWEFDRAALNAFAEAHPGGGWWLRLRAGSAGGWIANEQPLPIDADFRFVPVMFAGATFVAEVGYRFADGGWRGLSVSQPATTPPDSPSEAGPVTVARFEADPVTPDILVRSVPDHPEAVARPGQLPALPESRLLTTLVWESSVKRSGPSSAEVAEWVAREVTVRVPGDRGAADGASELLSPSSAELALPAPESSPASEAVPAVPPPPPGFWFKVNAELIIYGSTEADATVMIAGRPVRLRPDGSFSFRFALPDGEFTLPVIARNAAGTDGRSAGLRFSRATVLAGEVGVHPQDVTLRPPVAEAIGRPELSDPCMGDELVNLSGFIPDLQIELRYATRENFTGEILYATPEALLRRPTAEKLRAVQAELNLEGLGLKVWDAYRPPSVQRRMWDLRPEPRFVAPPDRGSRHSRGSSVDVTLVALSTGEELPMGTGFDEFTPRAAHDFSDLPAEIQASRRRLRAAMESHGFAGISSEWWHFDDVDWAAFPPVADG